ncbi:hypothetical protein DTL42_19380 [Bremerella cremea]|uniref:Uncharacterized protein n=1 Tax=Bremerella cremea TaxID=1031537 RepID=A0A368KMA4_9BACT|nr:hypothetical protein DTL42_19380 [Bremerella cremea]
MNYQLPQRLQEAVSRHSQVQDVSSLESEMAVARALLEQVSDSPSLATSLLQTITRLSREIELSMLRRKQLIHRDEMLQLTQQLVGLFVHEFQGTPGWEDKIERVSTTFVGMLAAPRDENGSFA